MKKNVFTLFLVAMSFLNVTAQETVGGRIFKNAKDKTYNKGEQKGDETDAFREGAGDDGRCYDCEFHLEQSKQNKRYRRSHAFVRVHFDITKESKIKWVTNDAIVNTVNRWANRGAERKRKPNGYPKQTHYTQTDKTFEHGRNHILLADHTAVEEGQTRRH